MDDVTAPVREQRPPAPARAHRPPAPARAHRPPAGGGPVRVVGLLVGLALLGAGAVGLHDGWVGLRDSGGQWLPAAVSWADGLVPGGWLLPVAVLAGLTGLVLLVVAALPRPRHAVPLRSATPVFLRRKDVARLVGAVAGDVDGVTRASAGVGRRTVTVAVRSTAVDGSDRAALSQQVTERVDDRLAPLDRRFRLRVGVAAGTE